MLVTSWYFDERRCEMRKINLWDLKKLDYDNHEEFLYIKQRLCRDRNGTIPMCLVRNGAHQGFRRKGGGNTTSKSRGECESFTHQGNKEAIGSLKEIVIIFNDKRVASIAMKIKTNGLYGYMICGTRQKTIDNWKLSKNGNWTAHIGDCNFTIIKSKDEISYGLVYGNGKILWEYNGKKFYSVEDAKINADFVAFKIFNGT